MLLPLQSELVIRPPPFRCNPTLIRNPQPGQLRESRMRRSEVHPESGLGKCGVRSAKRPFISLPGTGLLPDKALHCPDPVQVVIKNRAGGADSAPQLCPRLRIISEVDCQLDIVIVIAGNGVDDAHEPIEAGSVARPHELSRPGDDRTAAGECLQAGIAAAVMEGIQYHVAHFEERHKLRMTERLQNVGAVRQFRTRPGDACFYPAHRLGFSTGYQYQMAGWQ